MFKEFLDKIAAASNSRRTGQGYKWVPCFPGLWTPRAHLCAFESSPQLPVCSGQRCAPEFWLRVRAQ